MYDSFPFNHRIVSHSKQFTLYHACGQFDRPVLHVHTSRLANETETCNITNEYNFTMLLAPRTSPNDTYRLAQTPVYSEGEPFRGAFCLLHY